MNALIDTNVLLSAALRDRLPERVVLFVATHDDWKWLVTPEILAEYVEVLARPKFQLAAQTLADWTEMLDLRTVNVGSPPAVLEFPRDPKDAPFLAAALASHADFLITGDQDLLQAKDIVSTRIVTVADFAREFQIAECRSQPAPDKHKTVQARIVQYAQEYPLDVRPAPPGRRARRKSETTINRTKSRHSTVRTSSSTV